MPEVVERDKKGIKVAKNGTRKPSLAAEEAASTSFSHWSADASPTRTSHSASSEAVVAQGAAPARHDDEGDESDNASFESDDSRYNISLPPMLKSVFGIPNSRTPNPTLRGLNPKP